MKTLRRMREWMFPVAVVLFWGIGFTYTLTRLGEAHRVHELAAAARAAAPEPAPAPPVLARAD